MEVKCEECKKEFIMPCFKRDYAYRMIEVATNKASYYCSYTCMRKKELENKGVYMRRKGL